MKTLLMTSALTLAAFGSADNGLDAVLGSWRMVAPAEAVELAKKLGMPEPKAVITFASDRRFRYNAGAGESEIKRMGKVELRDGTLWLVGDDKWERPIAIAGSYVEVDGLRFQKEIKLTGSWLCGRNGTLDPDVQISFTKDGNFSFKCSNATSKGNYTFDGKTVTLTWTEVDGEKVTRGSMKKTITVSEEGTLNIDNWRYYKSN